MPAIPSTAVDLIGRLRALRCERNIVGQRRFGIISRSEQLGISMPELRALARQHRRAPARGRAAGGRMSSL